MLLQSKRPTTTRPQKSSVHSSGPTKHPSTHRPTSKLTSRLPSQLPTKLSSKFLADNTTSARPANFFKDLTNRLLSALPQDHQTVYLVGGLVLILLALLVFCCWCLRRPKSKANKTRRQIKIKSARLLDPTKVSALHTTATETQNDETMSLTNMPIETDLIELKKGSKSDPKLIKGKRKLKKITRKVSSKIPTDMQSELKSIYSCSSTLEKRANQPADKGQPILHLSTGSEISPTATQRIKKFRESSKAEMRVQSRRRSTAKGDLSADSAKKLRTVSKRDQSGELRRKLHRSRKSRAILKSRVRVSTEGARPKFKGRSSEATEARRSGERNKDRSADSDRSTSTGSIERTANSETREGEKDLKAKAHRSKRRTHRKLSMKRGHINLKIPSKRQPKRRLSRANNGTAESKLHSIKIYGKTIELKNKSNEVVSIFKQIPELDSSKLPAKEELYSPPSKNTLKKGKRIVSGISLSQSSSEELIRDIKRYKGRPKEKIKTKSTEPLLDGEFH